MKIGIKDIINVEMPSEERLREISIAWALEVGPTFIDQWPADLLSLSANTEFIDLPQDFVRIFDEKEYFDINCTDIAQQIDALLLFKRVFFRLNSRSPKDMPWPFEIPVSCSGKEMMNVISCSERMLDDLAYFSHAPLLPKLCLREFWPSIRPEMEFRCFIIDGQISAVAEYANASTRDLWGAPGGDYDDNLRKSIDKYLIEIVMPRLHMKTIVVDLCMPDRDWRLLEINPFGRSDPVGAGSYDAIKSGIASIARLPRSQSHD